MPFQSFTYSCITPKIKRRSKLRRGWEYQILWEATIDEYGKEKNPFYYIRIRKSFLFFKYWSVVKHEEAGLMDMYSVTTQFASKLEAAEYIDNVVRQGFDGQQTITELIRHGKL